MSPSEFQPRWTRVVVVVLLAGILISQWTLHVLDAREAARTRRVLESIQQLLEKDQQSQTEILGAIDDLQDLVEDIHGHLVPEEK